MKALLILILFIITNIAYSQYEVCGKIADSETGEELPGVSITEKGTSNGTITDYNGNYCFKVSSKDAVLIISFIGYASEEVKINNQPNININLSSDVTALDEIVVVGYGTYSGANRAYYSPNFRRTRSKSKQKGTTQVVTPHIPTKYTFNDESYTEVSENSFKSVKTAPLSTFSIDVDRASYSNIRRYLNNGQKPPKDAVRVEEMINYFKYNYQKNNSEHPLNIHTEVSACPWNKKHLVMQVSMKANEINDDDLPPSNLVFLIDVSGSMQDINKLPLVKSALHRLIDRLSESDKVAIVVYAGAAGMVLPSTNGSQKEKIHRAINNLSAGGSTAGGEGIRLAYDIAEKNFTKRGNNRIILATDGDFNVGESSDKAMEELITEKRKTGIYLTCLGFGMGNFKDSKLEILADKGNGNYAYIDNMQEAEKTLIEEFSSTMFTVAKDVKIQIEFNPSKIQSYRLVGYENRLLADEDFKNDTVDAGEVGAGHTITALYELIPVGVENEYNANIDELKYQNVPSSNFNEIANVKVRYKLPDSDISIPFEQAVLFTEQPDKEASENFRFACSVAMFGMYLSESSFAKDLKVTEIITMAEKAKQNDDEGYKAEFIRLMKLSTSL